MCLWRVCEALSSIFRSIPSACCLLRTHFMRVPNSIILDAVSYLLEPFLGESFQANPQPYRKHYFCFADFSSSRDHWNLSMLPHATQRYIDTPSHHFDRLNGSIIPLEMCFMNTTRFSCGTPCSVVETRKQQYATLKCPVCHRVWKGEQLALAVDFFAEEIVRGQRKIGGRLTGRELSTIRRIFVHHATNSMSEMEEEYWKRVNTVAELDYYVEWGVTIAEIRDTFKEACVDKVSEFLAQDSRTRDVEAYLNKFIPDEYDSDSDKTERANPRREGEGNENTESEAPSVHNNLSQGGSSSSRLEAIAEETEPEDEDTDDP
ncbi:hypothetical protein B0T19DRAFT_400845 [Cercophora scortea]|uniref:Uncharacterized protein n=1 Tax=Cercophora scortea TaxID=314031 RepID=A0AAE0IMT3_9PEZI|nr:hypothetical protein B0T19DRAFT_400845 [Cercophora scortea]